MIQPLVIAKDSNSKAELRLALAHHNLMSSFASYSNGFRQDIANQNPEILLLEIDEHLPAPETWELIRKIKRESKLPVIALIQRDKLESIALNPDIDDFLVTPYDSRELVFRINRLLHGTDRRAASRSKARG